MDNESKDRLKTCVNNESPQSVEELKQQIKEEQEKGFKYEAEIRIAEQHKYYHNSRVKELNKVLMNICDHVWESYREPYAYGERYEHCAKCDLYR